MTASDVIDVYLQLEKLGIKIWIDGGWSVDALLGEETRSHKDLDIAIQWKDVPALRKILETEGYKQINEDSKWNFVLADGRGREIDVHAFVYDDQGNIVDGIEYPSGSLTGHGTIDGHRVRCISPQHMVAFLAPWISKWPDKYLAAVSALCEKFAIDLPKEYLDYRKRTTQ
jgi:lincosamide nucleotidyltransferase A/C/D/E